MIRQSSASYRMKNHLLALSRNLFKAVGLFNSLLSQSLVILSELREIKDLLAAQHTPDQELRLIPASQAAARLKVETSTLLRWAQEGKLTLVKVGHLNYYKASEVR